MANVPDELRERLRRKVKDFKELNRLLDAKENEDLYLDDALEDALDNYNTLIQPVSHHTFTSFPSIVLLLKLAVIELLISNSILSTRNRVVYSDGKIGGIDTELKAGGYAEWATRLYNLTMKEAIALKTAQNLEAIGDSIPSDYAPTDEEEY